PVLQRSPTRRSSDLKDWVSSPSSTQASDGLGPLFNARSCQACHVKDGRGTVPGFEQFGQRDAVALLARLSRPASVQETRERIEQDRKSTRLNSSHVK